MNKLYIVMPVYNVEEIIENTIIIVTNKIRSLIKRKRINKDSKLVIVDDGSTDNSFLIIKNLIHIELIVVFILVYKSICSKFCDKKIFYTLMFQVITVSHSG